MMTIDVMDFMDLIYILIGFMDFTYMCYISFNYYLVLVFSNLPLYLCNRCMFKYVIKSPSIS